MASTHQHVLQQYWHDNEEYNPQEVGHHRIYDKIGCAEEEGVGLNLSNCHGDCLQQGVWESDKLLRWLLCVCACVWVGVSECVCVCVCV